MGMLSTSGRYACSDSDSGKQTCTIGQMRQHYEMQAPEGFLKGLMVMDDVAYFGISPPMERQDRDGQTVMCDLVAVDLSTRNEIFRRRLQTHGLLNVVSAPHLAESSTFIAVSTGVPATSSIAQSTLPSLKTGNIAQLKFQKTQQFSSVVASAATWSRSWMETALDESAVDGEWPSSMPRLNMEVKQRALRSRQGSGEPLESPIYVHLGKAPEALIAPVQVRG